MDAAELIRRRKALRMTQTELGSRFGMSRVGISLWENGHLPIRPWVDLAIGMLEVRETGILEDWDIMA